MGDNPAVRKYVPDYNKSGFTMAGSDVSLKAQFVECGEILSHASIFWPHFCHLFGKGDLRNFWTIRNKFQKAENP